MAKRAEYLGPERRRPLVLEAALEIFAGGGFADASMQAIADRAGVSKAVLYDCFPGGKQEIYYALLERSEHTFMEHMLGVLQRTENLPVDESLRIGLRAFLDYAEIHPHSFRVIFGDAGTRDPEVALRASRAREQVVAAIRERTRDIMQANDRPPSATSDVYPRTIVAVGEEIARWILRDPNAPREAIVDAVVNWFMRGFDELIPNGSRRPELVRD
ncbi:MAG: TetR/AcrR family transcriptional regulator [Actinomycetota bacterium]